MDHGRNCQTLVVIWITLHYGHSYGHGHGSMGSNTDPTGYCACVDTRYIIMYVTRRLFNSNNYYFATPAALAEVCAVRSAFLVN